MSDLLPTADRAGRSSRDGIAAALAARAIGATSAGSAMTTAAIQSRRPVIHAATVPRLAGEPILEELMKPHPTISKKLLELSYRVVRNYEG
jgi:hypothetical protein